MRTLPAVLVVVFALPAAAQEAPPLITDRPDQTESAAIVPRGMLQLETGATFARTAAGAGLNDDVLTLGGTLARLGIVPRLEARVGFAGYQRVESASALVADGFGDLDLGFKLQLLPGAGSVPQVAVIGSATLPTAQEGLGVTEVSPAVRLAVAHSVTDRLGVGWNVGAVFERSGPSGAVTTATDVLYTVVLGFAAAERVGVFLESFGTFGVSDGRANAHAVDGGLTFAVLPALQLDLSGGVGLNDGAEDWFVGAGISVRVPR